MLDLIKLSLSLKAFIFFGIFLEQFKKQASLKFYIIIIVYYLYVLREGITFPGVWPCIIDFQSEITDDINKRNMSKKKSYREKFGG